jgi:hypothetical protein
MILAANVALGPWIHVASDVELHVGARLGDKQAWRPKWRGCSTSACSSRGTGGRSIMQTFVPEISPLLGPDGIRRLPPRRRSPSTARCVAFLLTPSSQ